MPSNIMIWFSFSTNYSGNGLFLLEMAKRHRELNFLGLEINEKV